MWLLDVTEAFADAESTVQFQKVFGYHQAIRTGFESFKIPAIPHRNFCNYRRLISDLIPEVYENAYQTKSLQLHLQHYWTKWCAFLNNDLSLISFCVGATFDTLPSPSNLKRSRMITASSYFLMWGYLHFSTHFRSS